MTNLFNLNASLIKLLVEYNGMIFFYFYYDEDREKLWGNISLTNHLDTQGFFNIHKAGTNRTKFFEKYNYQTHLRNFRNVMD